jgi:hypothetical protein
MSEGRVDITATKKHHSFSSLSAVDVTPSAAHLPDITVTSLALCGRLEYGEQRFKGAARRVSLVSNDGAGITQQTTADAASGAFCFASVPPGRYRVAPYISADEKSKGLVFSPSHVDLQLAGQPLVNVVFSQAQLSVAGEVVCLAGPCPGDVQLVLRAADGKVAAAVRLDEVAIKNKQSSGEHWGVCVLWSIMLMLWLIMDKLHIINSCLPLHGLICKGVLQQKCCRVSCLFRVCSV